MSVYRNAGDPPAPSATLLHLRPRQKWNTAGIGATVYAPGWTVENYPMRGFQSTVDGRVHVPFHDGKVVVRWPDGTRELVELGKERTIVQGEHEPLTEAAARAWRDEVAVPQRDKSITARVGGVRYSHDAAPATDFDRTPLYPLGISNEGPALATDGTTTFVGNAAGRSGMLFAEKRFRAHLPGINEGENVDATFFDANGDGYSDLYVVNGSNQFSEGNTALLDKLYFGGPNGKFTASEQLLPVGSRFSAGSCVRAYDVDADGDEDLFVGGRLRPGSYGVPAESFLLLNDGKGKFKPAKIAPFKKLGLVTDALWADVDGDLTTRELVVVREWDDVLVFHFAGTSLASVDTLPGTSGLWRSAAAADLDGDGRTDLVLGNWGENTLLKASHGEPLELHVNDFDRNGAIDQLLVATERSGDTLRRYPLTLRDDLVKSLPALRKNAPRYGDYARREWEELFPRAVREKSVVGRAVTLSSVALMNGGRGGWTVKPLPRRAQIAPIYAIHPADLDGDGDTDLIVGGNQGVVKPELGTNVGDFMSILLNDGDGQFLYLGPEDTGLVIPQEVRGIVRRDDGRYWVATHGDQLLFISIETNASR